MKKLYTTILAACLMITAQAQNPFEWVKQVGINTDESGNAITTDTDGNVLTIGDFQGTVDFDPGPGVQNLVSGNGNDDVFIQKLDANGNFLWAQSIGNPDYYDKGKSIITDADNNVYVISNFDEWIENADLSVIKLNANGNILWTKLYDATTNVVGGNSVALDASGNIIITGYFRGIVDFDPGTGVQNLTAIGWTDTFVLKLDTNGDFLWVKQVEGSSGGRAIARDANGHLYVTGSFNGTPDFDPGAGVQNLTSAGTNDVFVLKLDGNGNFMWVKQSGSTAYDRGYSITIDAGGNVLVAGIFQETVDFDPGTGVQNLTSNGSYDIFIQKLDANGNFLWVKQAGSSDYDFVRGMKMDANGNIYITGAFRETADFDPGSGEQNLTSLGESDIFIQKLDANGDFLWVKQMGGIADDYGMDITTDINGNIYTTGYFEETVDFDPGMDVENLTSAGASDFFVHKLEGSLVNLYEPAENTAFTLYPNPTKGQFSLSFEEILPEIDITIKDVQGRLVQSSRHQQTDNIDLKLNRPAGVYYLEIKTQEGKTTTSIIKK